MSSNPTPPELGGGPVRKKSALPWILGGLGGCLLLVLIIVAGFTFFIARKAKQAGVDADLLRRNPALAAARMAVAVNPDVEIVSTDEGRGQITIHNRKTGKTVTMSFEDAKNGRFSVQDGDGKSSVIIGGKAKFPAWVPDYPGSNPQGAFSAQGEGSAAGTFTFKTSDSPDKVLKYYEDEFKAAGMKITTKVSSEDNDRRSGGVITGVDEHNNHTVNVVLGQDNGETTVAITYASGK